MYFNFSHQIYLVFLFIIPIIIFLHFFSLKNLRGSSLKFANFRAIARIKGIDLYSRNIFLLFLNIFLITLLVFGLSGLTLYKEMDASVFSFVIAIDSSGSMAASDLKPDRLSAAKETAINFVDSLPFESYVGIVSFSGNSIIEKEITKDKLELKQGIKNIELSSVGGTDIYEVILNSAGLLKKEKNKAIILLSDGQINVGDIDASMEYANDREIMIQTIGIGTIEGGEVSYGISKLDEDSLKALAYNTGGQYFHVTTKAELESSFNQLVEVTRKVGSIDLSPYLIIFVITLFTIKEFLLSFNKIGW